MHALGTMFVDVVTGLFFVGLVGSAIVILISFVEDFQELFGEDEGPAPAPVAPPQAESAKRA